MYNSCLDNEPLNKILTIIQLSFYCLMSIIVIGKFSNTLRRQQKKTILHLISFFLLLYVCLETGIQIYLTAVLFSKQSNSLPFINYTGLNIFCIGLDTYLMFYLSMYWRRLKYELTSSIIETLSEKAETFTAWSKFKLISLTLLSLAYLGYFIYFAVKLKGREQRWVIFGLAQILACSLLVIGIITQTRRGIFLIKALDNYQKILSDIQINKTRFLTIFITVSLFSFLRCLLFTYVIVVGFEVNSKDNNWTSTSCPQQYSLYAFTFSAIIPIFALSLGFVSKKQQETMSEPKNLKSSRQKLMKNPDKSKSSNQTGSLHETQLSQQFDKTKSRQ